MLSVATDVSFLVRIKAFSEHSVHTAAESNRNSIANAQDLGSSICLLWAILYEFNIGSVCTTSTKSFYSIQLHRLKAEHCGPIEFICHRFVGISSSTIQYRKPV